MIRKLIFCLAAAGMTLAGSARQLTPAEALSRGTSSTRMMVHGIGTASYDPASPVYTASEAGVQSLYVFNAIDGNGYLVVSADDAAVPVLGYSDSGSFDPDNMSEALRWWLDQYSGEIAYAVANGLSDNRMMAPTRRNVAPMLATRWSQYSPFNDLCPGLAGCISISMGQIMAYHRWPESIDWSKINNVYNQNSSQESCAAVAALISELGTRVNMTYSSSYSYTTSDSIMPVLYNTYGYDVGMRHLKRRHYTTAEWEECLYNELASGRPVIYGGQMPANPLSGHSFICDGYANGYYHFNWGWAGADDGYYLLSALNPTTASLTGYVGGYSYDQDIVIGIRRPVEGSAPVHEVYINGDFSTRDANSSYVYFISQISTNNGFYYSGPTSVKTHLGIKVEDTQGNVTYMEARGDASPMGIKNPRAYFRVLCSSLPDGVYKVSPAFDDADTGEWFDIQVPVNKVNTLIMTVSGGQVTFERPQDVPTLTVDEFSVNTPVIVNNKVEVRATLTANQEYSTRVRVVVYPTGGETPVLYGQYVYLSLQPETPFSLDYVSQLNMLVGATAPAAGEYELQLVNDDGLGLSERVAVTLREAQAAKITISDIEVVGYPNVPGNDIRVRGRLNCRSGCFVDYIDLHLFPNVEGSVQDITSFRSGLIVADEGETVDFEVKGWYLESDPATMYFLGLYVGYSSLNLRTEPFYIGRPALTFNVDNHGAVSPTNFVTCDAQGQWYAQDVVLDDDYDFVAPYSFLAYSLRYSRHFDDTSWQPLFVPFAIPYARWSTLADVAVPVAVAGSADAPVMQWQTLNSGDIAPGRPYLIRPRSAGQMVISGEDINVNSHHYEPVTLVHGATAATFSIHGNYSATSGLDSSANYVVDNGVMTLVGDGAYRLAPYRFYVSTTAASAAARMRIEIDGVDAAGLGEIIFESAGDGIYYDMLGRRVDHPTTGIYIVDGRKVYVK